MKNKETLEEAAIRLYPDNIIKLGNETSYNAALLKRKDFIKGGNWVKERMYSEEEVKSLLHKFMQHRHPDWHGWSTTKWFEQNKKK